MRFDPSVDPGGELLDELGVFGLAVRVDLDGWVPAVHGRAVAVEVVGLVVKPGGVDAGEQPHRPGQDLLGGAVVDGQLLAAPPYTDAEATQ